MPRVGSANLGNGRGSAPQLTVDQILTWADIHRERKGKWPKHTSGRVYLASFETWKGLDTSLRRGYRGLPGGSSLARLLAEHRGVRNHRALPLLSLEQVLV